MRVIKWQFLRDNKLKIALPFDIIRGLLEEAKYGIGGSELLLDKENALRKRAFIKMLLDKGLMKIDLSQDNPVYSITAKGRRFLSELSEFYSEESRSSELRLNA